MKDIKAKVDELKSRFDEFMSDLSITHNPTQSFEEKFNDMLYVDNDVLLTVLKNYSEILGPIRIAVAETGRDGLVQCAYSFHAGWPVMDNTFVICSFKANPKKVEVPLYKWLYEIASIEATTNDEQQRQRHHLLKDTVWQIYEDCLTLQASADKNLNKAAISNSKPNEEFAGVAILLNENLLSK